MSYQNPNDDCDGSLATLVEAEMVAAFSSPDSGEAIHGGAGLEEASTAQPCSEEQAADRNGKLWFVSELCHQRSRRDIGSFDHATYGGGEDDDYDPYDDDDEEDDDEEDDFFPDDSDEDFDDEDDDEDEDFDDDLEDVIRLSA